MPDTPAGARPGLLLTGATGFIGEALLPQLVARYEVTALARTPRESAPGVRWVRADLTQPLPIDGLPTRVDAVLHLASLRAPPGEERVADLFAVNAGAVAALLAYARRAGATRFVLGSTGGVCGYRRGPIAETAAARPFDLYTLSKWHGETIARLQRDVPAAIVRFFFPYGPGQPAGLMPRLAGSIADGRPITLFNGGRHPRLNPVYVADACDLTLRALACGRDLVVNCAGPDVATIRRIALTIGGILGLTPRFVREENPRIGNMAASLAHARDALGFAPSVGLRRGLEATFGAGA